MKIIVQAPVKVTFKVDTNDNLNHYGNEQKKTREYVFVHKRQIRDFGQGLASHILMSNKDTSNTATEDTTGNSTTIKTTTLKATAERIRVRPILARSATSSTGT